MTDTATARGQWLAQVKVFASDARRYFSHPSQRKSELDPDLLHDNGIEYRAANGVCLAFHAAGWHSVYMVHIGVLPEMWGCLDATCSQILAQFQTEVSAERIVAWVPNDNRAVLALARRIGFEIDGAMRLPSGEVTMIGWSQ